MSHWRSLWHLDIVKTRPRESYEKDNPFCVSRMADESSFLFVSMEHHNIGKRQSHDPIHQGISGRTSTSGTRGGVATSFYCCSFRYIHVNIRSAVQFWWYLDISWLILQPPIRSSLIVTIPHLLYYQSLRRWNWTPANLTQCTDNWLPTSLALHIIDYYLLTLASIFVCPWKHPHPKTIHTKPQKSKTLYNAWLGTH